MKSWYKFQEGYIKSKSEEEARETLNNIYNKIFEKEFEMDFDLEVLGKDLDRVYEKLMRNLKANGLKTRNFEVLIDTDRPKDKENSVMLKKANRNKFGFQGIKTKIVEL